MPFYKGHQLNLGHGYNRTHPELYRKFHAMKQRCYNKKHKHYQYYGGKGIRICDEWLNNPIKFYEWATDHGYKEDADLTIERINRNKNYCPENCCFIPSSKQAQNTGRSLHLTINEQTHCAREWSRIIGVAPRTIPCWVERHGIEYAVTRIKETLSNGFTPNGVILVTIDNQTKSISQWAKESGINNRTLTRWYHKHGIDYVITQINIRLNPKKAR